MKIFLKRLPVATIAILVSVSFTNVLAQAKSVMPVLPAKNDSVFAKVEIEASFPGGPAAWTRYVTNAIVENQGKLKKSDYGTCIIKFIVDTRGRVSEVVATTMENSRLAKIAVEAIANGPKWHPAQQDGKFVNAYRLQPVTLTDPGK